MIDVGGGSTEIAIGDAAGRVTHAESIPVGSSVLADRHLRSDPPTDSELEAVREEVAHAFDWFDAPAVDHAVAVGGSATSLLHLAGERARAGGTRRSARNVARGTDGGARDSRWVGPVRVRLLPAGVLVLAELARQMAQPLRICKGGLREGVILEMIGSSD